MLYFDGNPPASDLEKEYCNVVIKGMSFKDPVYVEPITEQVLQLTIERGCEVGKSLKFYDFPIWDSPVFIMERNAVRYSDFIHPQKLTLLRTIVSEKQQWTGFCISLEKIRNNMLNVGDKMPDFEVMDHADNLHLRRERHPHRDNRKGRHEESCRPDLEVVCFGENLTQYTAFTMSR